MSSRLSRGIRRNALQKLAALSATSSSTPFENSDLQRLCKSVGGKTHKSDGYASGMPGSLGRQPMVNNRRDELLDFFLTP